MPTDGVDAFSRLAADRPAGLVEAALEIARDEYPDLDIAGYLARLAEMVAGFAREREVESSLADSLAALNRYFFGELGFAGNKSEYYDPRNSYLNDVIDRRVGIPISLCVLYRELARGAGIALEGINFPGHFLLAARLPAGGRLYVDVFHSGQLLDWRQCKARLEHGPALAFEERDFPAMSEREILTRMLRNLKGIYGRSDPGRCARVQERITRLWPGDPAESRDLGILYARSGRPVAAVRTFESLLRDHPDWSERESVEGYLAHAKREAVLVN